jgi:hypothetical protein
MASVMQSGAGIQEVNILPRAQASHQPGSDTRWREATHVRSRVEHVSRVGIAPRKGWARRGLARENHPRRPEPRGGGTADSRTPLERRLGPGARGTTGQRPPGSSTRACGDRENTGTRERLIGLRSQPSRSSAEPNTPRGVHRAITAPPERPAAPPGRSLQHNAGTTGTEGPAGTRRHSGGA